MMNRPKFQNQAGDTIVEVLISIAIVGLALAGGYALSNYSLQSGLDSSQRDSAVLLANGQVEFLKNAQARFNSNSTTLLSTYTGAAQPFCINPSTGQPASSSSTSCDFNGVRMFITYNSCGVFMVEPRWTSFRGDGDARAELFYKLPDDFYQDEPKC